MSIHVTPMVSNKSIEQQKLIGEHSLSKHFRLPQSTTDLSQYHNILVWDLISKVLSHSSSTLLGLARLLFLVDAQIIAPK